jgi:hypothetical protein
MDNRHQSRKPYVFDFSQALDLIIQQLRVSLDCGHAGSLHRVDQLRDYEPHILSVVAR